MREALEICKVRSIICNLRFVHTNLAEGIGSRPLNFKRWKKSYASRSKILALVWCSLSAISTTIWHRSTRSAIFLWQHPKPLTLSRTRRFTIFGLEYSWAACLSFPPELVMLYTRAIDTDFDVDGVQCLRWLETIGLDLERGTPLYDVDKIHSYVRELRMSLRFVMFLKLRTCLKISSLFL